ncbi:hypothetical protein BDW22DRAFT_1334993 [Trametopsis cervina]|nr:hypothetical protein BDW22DRAFT_1334993 [Trametopsis cervina]
MFRLLPALFVAVAVVAAPSRRASVAFVDPTTGGGTWLDHNPGSDLGEPLNVVVSGLSSPTVLDLKGQGFMNYVKSFDFSQECLGLHQGDPQSANLGDGNGLVNQTVEIRQDFGNSVFGSCLESLTGGNHFRVFIQNGPAANTGALFLAASQEEDLSQGHTISPNGYNVGRDALVKAAVGTHSFQGVTYTTTSQVLSGVMPAGSNGVNHGIAVDGNAVLLTVTTS